MYVPTICGVDAGSVMPDAIPGATWIDTIPYDPKSQMADIADLGQDAFVAAYVHVAFAPMHVAFDVTGAPLAPPAAYPRGGHSRWLRANSSPSWRVGGCDTNYFAVELRDEVRLETHARCGGAAVSVTETVVDVIDVFSRPSLATRGTPQDGALLVVYGKGNQVVGRLLRFRDGAPESQFGPPFVIMEVPSTRAVFSTDVIYNQHSDRFIVGEIDRYAEQGCRIRNAVVAVDANLSATVEREKVFGECDTGAGGHHTAVAYNPRGDGTYLWWRQNKKPDLTKAIYVHDAWGELTTRTALSHRRWARRDGDLPPLHSAHRVSGRRADPVRVRQVGAPAAGRPRPATATRSARRRPGPGSPTCRRWPGRWRCASSAGGSSVSSEARRSGKSASPPICFSPAPR